VEFNGRGNRGLKKSSEVFGLSKISEIARLP
jgi:hypothetical protein